MILPCCNVSYAASDGAKDFNPRCVPSLYKRPFVALFVAGECERAFFGWMCLFFNCYNFHAFVINSRHVGSLREVRLATFKGCVENTPFVWQCFERMLRDC